MRNTVTQARVLAQIPSKSNPAKSYEIRLGGDGVVYCTCPAWKLHGNKWCKHLEEYHDHSGVQGKQLLKFYEEETQKKNLQKHLISQHNDVCTVCGCSKHAIEEFGFECNPASMDDVITSIITGQWRDPRGGDHGLRHPEN